MYIFLYEVTNLRMYLILKKSCVKFYMENIFILFQKVWAQWPRAHSVLKSITIVEASRIRQIGLLEGILLVDWYNWTKNCILPAVVTPEQILKYEVDVGNFNKTAMHLLTVRQIWLREFYKKLWGFPLYVKFSLNCTDYMTEFQMIKFKNYVCKLIKNKCTCESVIEKFKLNIFTYYDVKCMMEFSKFAHEDENGLGYIVKKGSDEVYS